VPRIIRGIYAYHTKSNGWSDVGYNFLVDRFGRLWEGRYGGISRAVIGAHSGGFNENTFGVSAIGNFDSAGAPAAMVDSIARLMAWKLSLHYRNPTGKTTLTSAGGGTSRYGAGTKVVKNVISAHRNVGYTACPGKYLYARMSTIRSKALSYMGAALVSPKASSSSQPYQGSPITVTAGVLRSQSWRLEVRERCRGTLVRTIKGTASPSSPIKASWGLHNSAGGWVRPGAYDLTLSSWDTSRTARPWHKGVSIQVTSPTTTASKVALPGAVSFVPVTPARIYNTRASGRQPLGHNSRRDVKVLGVGGVPASGVSAVAVNVTATCPTSGSYLTVWPAGRTRPSAATLNLAGGTSRGAFTVAAVGGEGKVSIANSTGITDLVVDVLGYYPTSGTGDLYHPVHPFRLASTPATGGALAPSESRTFSMPELEGVRPSQMTGAVLNVTALGSNTQPGHLAVFPSNTSSAGTTALHYSNHGSVANRTVAKLASGRFTLRNYSATTHVVIDVVGFYAPSTVTGGGRFQALSPTRVLDTRTGLGSAKQRLGPGKVLAVDATGSGKPVPNGATAVVMTLTATGATSRTSLTAWENGTATPGTSDLSTAAGVTTRNLAVVPLSGWGYLKIENRSGYTHVVGDVIGYYR
ncbi:MAG: N-acetylmuramoyl-L-alanine amidase, partial [Actinomycetes bacterium]